MRHIRKLIYRLGFRPNPGTILYSPSEAFMYMALEWFSQELTKKHK